MRRSIPLLIFLSLLMTGAQLRADRPRRGPEAVTAEIAKIRQTLTVSEYRHRPLVRPGRGIYRWDCSAMADWVLGRAAPAARAAVRRLGGERPLAVHFYRTIARLDPGERRGAWERLRTAGHARPGDVLAWKRPSWFPSKNTGHVAFVVGEPRLTDTPVRGVLLEIADASRYRHEDDSREPGQTGFGTGTILLPVDGDLQPIGYGWVGSRTPEEYIVPTEEMVIGRPLR